MEFEQANIYLRKFDVWSLKLFDSFIVIYYDCVRGMATSFIRYLSRFGFSFFKLKWKTKNKPQIWISMFSYFENGKTAYFDVFCLNFSIETKIKTLFLISYFNLSKKTKWHIGYTDSEVLVSYKRWFYSLLTCFCLWQFSINQHLNHKQNEKEIVIASVINKYLQ